MSEITNPDGQWIELADASAAEKDVVLTPLNSSRIICQIAGSIPSNGSDDGFEIVNDLATAVKVGSGNYLYGRTISNTGKGLKLNVQDVTP